ncbi:uncharacterized protein SCHCODRAFT_02505943, partial [Schizophyllum commune H4-8]|uniref:uncharacterized protein n=1 Tax=Schizophyllum commune (strain H4-8 / FGSC 9210) TaxID=578458 RepID=UPI00215E1F40
MKAKQKTKGRNQTTTATEPSFPPPPPSEEVLHKITADFLRDCYALEESGCAVCGELKPLTSLTALSDIVNTLSPLIADDVGVKEDGSARDQGKPVLAPGLDQVCSDCRGPLSRNQMPRMALANDLWIGEVPLELRQLRYFERILVQRVRHNAVFVKVAGGYRKSIAHVISFPVDTEEIYGKLPPTK